MREGRQRYEQRTSLHREVTPPLLASWSLSQKASAAEMPDQRINHLRVVQSARNRFLRRPPWGGWWLRVHAKITWSIVPNLWRNRVVPIPKELAVQDLKLSELLVGDLQTVLIEIEVKVGVHQ
jgi:hypothetical protein